MQQARLYILILIQTGNTDKKGIVMEFLELAKSRYSVRKFKKEQISDDSKLWVKLQGADDPLLKRIELILTMFPGRQQLIIYLEREKRRIGARCLIHPSLVAELKELCGEDNVILKAH